jgi:2-phosphosulfolactate phosphatase
MSEGKVVSQKIEICFSPCSYASYKDDESIVVIVDILRATSAICTAFEHGVSKIIPVATVEEALVYKQKGFLVGAERNGLALDGFDFGNSPFSYMSDSIKGKEIVLTTTNGTQAIEVSRKAYKVVVGSFLNISSLCAWLLKQNRKVLLLCSGWKDRFNLEDALFAGAVADTLSLQKEFNALGDSAIASKFLYQSAKEDPYKFLKNSSHKERLAKLNLKDDIKYCLALDKTTVIPVLQGDALVKLI